ncbi:hypothetical protein SEVIR_5G430133v4 [Setaria viridis]
MLGPPNQRAAAMHKLSLRRHLRQLLRHAAGQEIPPGFLLHPYPDHLIRQRIHSQQSHAASRRSGRRATQLVARCCRAGASTARLPASPLPPCRIHPAPSPPQCHHLLHQPRQVAACRRRAAVDTLVPFPSIASHMSLSLAGRVPSRRCCPVTCHSPLQH